MKPVVLAMVLETMMEICMDCGDYAQRHNTYSASFRVFRVLVLRSVPFHSVK